MNPPPILSWRRPFNVIVHRKSFVVNAVDESPFFELLLILLIIISLIYKKTLDFVYIYIFLCKDVVLFSLKIFFSRRKLDQICVFIFKSF